ncbi:UNVERIFIED_ORG: transposase [Arthrobacter sp. UYCu721]
MIDVGEWAEIRRLHMTEGLSVREIASRLGIARKTVDRALANEQPAKYPTRSRPSIVDPYVQDMTRILTQFPRMGAPTLAQRVGYTGGPSVFRAKTAEIKATLAIPDPVDHLSFDPGEMIQCDLWFPNERIIPTGHGTMLSPPVLTMASGYSRWIMAHMLPSRTTGDLVAGMSLLLESLGAVPGKLLWDNEAGIGRGGKLTDTVQQFAGTLGLSIRQTRPYDPESKGLVERANQYLQTSFLPGRAFDSIPDFNAQLDQWLITVANARKVRRIGNTTPAANIRDDLNAMMPLPPMMPKGGFSDRRKLGRDYVFRVLGNDYSCPPELIGKMIDIHAGLTTVLFVHQGRTAAEHPRCIDTGKIIIDPEHINQAEHLRRAFQTRSPASPVHTAGARVEYRALSTYDDVFGISIRDEPTPEDQ